MKIKAATTIPDVEFRVVLNRKAGILHLWALGSSENCDLFTEQPIDQHPLAWVKKDVCYFYYNTKRPIFKGWDLIMPDRSITKFKGVKE